MARGVNKVFLIGNLGQDPEVRFMPSGNPVANFSLATTDTWTDKQSGQRQERTEWHRCNAFGKLAEIIQQYVKKGSKVYVEGSIHTRKWQDQSGQDRYSTELKVRDMQMLDGRQGGQQQGGGYGAPPQGQAGGYGAPPQQGGYGAPQGGHPPPQGQGRPPQQGAPNQGQNYGAPDPGSFDDFDDEIPFD